MAKYPRKVKDGKIFTIYLDKPHLEHVKRVARRMSLEQERDISTCEAIRIALETIYPMNTQLEMFQSSTPQAKRRLREANQLFFTDIDVEEESEV